MWWYVCGRFTEKFLPRTDTKCLVRGGLNSKGSGECPHLRRAIFARLPAFGGAFGLVYPEPSCALVLGLMFRVRDFFLLIPPVAPLKF